MTHITSLIRSLKPINYLFALVIGVCIVQVVFTYSTERSHAAEPEISPAFVTKKSHQKAVQVQDDSERVMGVTGGDCKKCHPSEVAAWMKTVHFQSHDLKLFKYGANTKKYAEALKINPATLLTDSMCGDCHGTKAKKEGAVKVISGVSCESCHAPAGGEKGWLNRHQSYHASMPTTRKQETAEHRAARLKYCDEVGMLRSENFFGLAKACLSCHIIGNEELIAAGHKAASDFDFVSWSEGEVKHNFLVDKTKNADAPSLWMEQTGGTPANYKRLKYVAGYLAKLDVLLRIRANVTSRKFARKLKGPIGDANDIIEEINDIVEADELEEVLDILSDLKVSKIKNDDKKTYPAAADKIAEQAKLFSKNHAKLDDVADIEDFDDLIKESEPHYSPQYKKKYLN